MASANEFEPQSWNRYSYVINNPLNNIDPLGLYNVGGGTAEDNPQEPQKKPDPEDLIGITKVPQSEFEVAVININDDKNTGRPLNEGEVAARKLRNFMGLPLADEFDSRAQFPGTPNDNPGETIPERYLRAPTQTALEVARWASQGTRNAAYAMTPDYGYVSG